MKPHYPIHNILHTFLLFLIFFQKVLVRINLILKLIINNREGDLPF